MKSELLQIFSERGYINQCTDTERLDEVLSKGKITAYIGYDCTAESLHVGHLLSIMMLRWLQKCGHKPIALMGGATTKIGDPTFKDKSRPMLSDEDIENNIKGIKTAFSKFINFGEGETDGIMVNNIDWIGKLNYLQFLSDFGRHFTINRMLTFDSVKLRLERELPMTFLEFNYMILQGYDFLELNKRYGCTLQMGGSDQWGNIINGVELGRKVENKELFGLTCPLIMTSSGVKMGKTEGGAVWLNEDKLSSYDYWQYFRNTEDGDVGKFLRLFTELPISEIEKLEKLGGAEINDAKKILANEATKLCRGITAAVEAEATARKTFEEGSVGGELPSINLNRDNISSYSLISALKELGLCASNGEAKRLIQGGGARINDEQILKEDYVLQLSDIKEGIIKISSGKKKHGVIKVC